MIIWPHLYSGIQFLEKKLSTPETTELKEMNWKEFKKEGKRWEEKASIEEVKKIKGQIRLTFCGSSRVWEHQERDATEIAPFLLSSYVLFPIVGSVG